MTLSQKLTTGIASAALALTTFVMSATAQTNYTVEPWVYDPNNECPGITSNWDYSLGNPEPSLLVSKPCPITANAAAGATIEGVEGQVLTELDFDYMGYCGAGSPRYNVYTTNGTYYFFGCIHGDQTPLGNGWTHVEFTDADAFPADGVTPWPGFGNVTVTGIDLVQDETGSTYVDNFSINGQVIGGPTREQAKDSCKKGGWQNYTSAPGPFKNQGQCVSYFAKGGN